MAGESPFNGKTKYEVMKQNKKCNIEFKAACWKELNVEALNLMKEMLLKDPLKRISAKQALDHPWFSVPHNSFIGMLSAEEKMNKYSGCDRFKMDRIKPEFNMTSYTPLFHSEITQTIIPYKTPIQLPEKLLPKPKNCGLFKNSIFHKVIRTRNTNSKVNKYSGNEFFDNEENFQTEDINELPFGAQSMATMKLPLKYNRPLQMSINERLQKQIGPHDNCYTRLIANEKYVSHISRELLAELYQGDCISVDATEDL